MDHVEAVLASSVRILCCTEPLLSELLALGATADGKVLSISFGSKESIASVLAELQRLSIPFGDAPSGWPPAAVFAHLREEGLVHGSIVAISWSSPGKPVLRAA